jgi:hypothetical protein
VARLAKREEKTMRETNLKTSAWRGRRLSPLARRWVPNSAWAWGVMAILAVAVLAPSSAQAAITEIIDATGDGAGKTLFFPDSIAVDDATGDVYITGKLSHNAFKITPGGVITEIIDGTGDGTNGLSAPEGVAVDGSGNVYVAGGGSNNAFKIDTSVTCDTGGTPACTITEIIDTNGDGINTLDLPVGIAVDGSGNVYVAGFNSDNAFKITPGGSIFEIIDATGDGGNSLTNAEGVAVDGSGNVYVTGSGSSNAFKIATPGTCDTVSTPCTITQIIDATGDSTNALDAPHCITADGSGNVYVAGFGSHNAFKIEAPGTCSTGGTPCTITQIIDAVGAGSGKALNYAAAIAADGSGNVYVAGFDSDNAFKIATPGTCSTGGTPCTITQIIDATGDGTNALDAPQGITADGSGNVYVKGSGSNNAFQITSGSGSAIPALSLRGMLLAFLLLALAGALAHLQRRRARGAA